MVLTSLVALLVFAPFTLVFAPSVTGVVQRSQQVYAELIGADRAGANITAVAAQYNVALGLIDEAKRLDESGNHTGASELAQRADSILNSTASSATELNANALAHQGIKRLERLLAAPLEALALAAIIIAFIAIRRRIEFNRMREMRIVSE